MRYILLIFLSSIVSASLYSQTHTAKIVTNYGTIKVMLYDGTPLHRDNFIKLADAHFFDSLLFHRVIKGFVIQAGDPTSKTANDTALLGDGDLGYTIPAEIVPDKYYHKVGALAAARDDNPSKASSACQFYIVQGQVANDSTFARARIRSNGYEIPEDHKAVYRKDGGTPQLDSRYTVFGEVVSGMNIVDKIADVATDKNDRPKEPVRIISIRMVK
jgi:peptidyl-prolyl cis-trans isomerase B (cyclophilin B)